MERAILVTVDLGKETEWSAGERSQGLAELAVSGGAKIVKEEIVKRDNPNPAYFIGSGKAIEIAALCADEHADTVIFNNDLSGTQQKNLEDVMRKKVVDRTQLILDIFARHAHSNEGKVQVELAQLLYMLPRLTGKGVQLSRLGGGIGTRGPGEQKLEMDRRRIRTRIVKLKNELETLRERRGMMRKKRERFSLVTAAIIGYTNVGKSTLLNALTSSDVIVQDKLFSTLDPTVRKFILPNKQKILFIDTVGFLVHLPHHLIEAFKATLEEVVDADLLLHVVDVSHPKMREQVAAVYKVLEEIGAHDKKIITVVNKIDKLTEPSVLERAMSYFDNAVAISALKREGFDALVDSLIGHIRGFIARLEITIPQTDTRTLNLIYENGFVTKADYEGQEIHIEAEVPLRIRDILAKGPYKIS